MDGGRGDHSHSEDSDFFPGAGFCSNERTPGGDAGAEHGCGQLGWNIIWNEECKIFVGPDMARISSLRACTVGVWCVIRSWSGGKYKSIELVHFKP